MGRSRMVRFVVKMTMSSPTPEHNTLSDGGEWPTKHAGRPTDANLAKYVAHFEASTAPGGCNEHLGRRVVWAAEVVDQLNGNAVRATYRGPSFAVV